MAKTHPNGQKKKIVTLKSAEATDGVKKKKKKKPSKLKKMILLVRLLLFEARIESIIWLSYRVTCNFFKNRPGFVFLGGQDSAKQHAKLCDM